MHKPWNFILFGVYSTLILQVITQKTTASNVLRLPRDVPQDGILAATVAASSLKTDFYHMGLPPGYNMHELPKHSSGRPMEIFIQCNVRKILDLDEHAESITMDLEFRVFWTDYKIRDYFNARKAELGIKRMSYGDMTPEERKNLTRTLNDPNMLDSVWTPNLFIGNLLKVTQPVAMAKPITLKVIPDIAAFEYLNRISVSTDCPMQFKYYPADTQECIFKVRSFSYTANDLLLRWYKTGVWLHELETSNFDIRVGQLRNFTKIEDDEDTLSEVFHVFEFRIHFRRRLSYHIVQTYLPSTFYIIITCLCFLLPSRFIEARIGIAMTTLLTLTAMFAAVRESTPSVSYVKAIDTWMAGCIMFVFLTLAEFTFITWLRSVKEEYDEMLAKKTDDDAESSSGDKMELKIFSRPRRGHPSLVGNLKIRTYERLMIFLEKYNFPIFIAIITVFSVIYWLWLLNSANYFEWEIDETYNNVYGDPW